ncbi:TRAP transporter substrate-binding protein DctP [uncultured Roseibium sp.]|uniref:TRAP transporter substrate-binding protein n=1 Tax=uncultured Roseibium sp. TaxID=1936171 RepID=UPI003216D3C3
MKLKALTLIALMAMAAPASAEVKIALDSKPDLETSGSYNWAHAFGEVLREAGMDVREMPRGSVGNESEKFDQLSTGLLEVSLSDVRAVAQVDPFIYGVRLPYIFDDMAHMDRALEKGKVFDRINEAISKQDVKLLALVPLGPSSGIITTTAVVRKPADMADLRMRALDDAQIAMYKAWGSSGTVVPWGEVPAGLQNRRD